MLHGHKTNEPCSLRHELPPPMGTEVWRADTERRYEVRQKRCFKGSWQQGIGRCGSTGSLLLLFEV